MRMLWPPTDKGVLLASFLRFHFRSPLGHCKWAHVARFLFPFIKPIKDEGTHHKPLWEWYFTFYPCLGMAVGRRQRQLFHAQCIQTILLHISIESILLPPSQNECPRLNVYWLCWCRKLFGTPNCWYFFCINIINKALIFWGHKTPWSSRTFRESPFLINVPFITLYIYIYIYIYIYMFVWLSVKEFKLLPTKRRDRERERIRVYL